MELKATGFEDARFKLIRSKVLAKKRFIIITKIITDNAKLLLPNILRQSTTGTLINRNTVETKSLEKSLDYFPFRIQFLTFLC